MKTACLLLILFLLLVTSSSDASWSRFAYVSPETEEKYDIKVVVEESNENSGLVKIRISARNYTFKIATLVETERPLSRSAQEALRPILWGRTDLPFKTNIVFKTRLSHDKKSVLEKGISHDGQVSKEYDELFYEIETKVCNRNLYVYIDFPRRLVDGGYWYSIDLSKYLAQLDCSQ